MENANEILIQCFKAERDEKTKILTGIYAKIIEVNDKYGPEMAYQKQCELQFRIDALMDRIEVLDRKIEKCLENI